MDRTAIQLVHRQDLYIAPRIVELGMLHAGHRFGVVDGQVHEIVLPPFARKSVGLVWQSGDAQNTGWTDGHSAFAVYQSTLTGLLLRVMKPAKGAGEVALFLQFRDKAGTFDAHLISDSYANRSKIEAYIDKLRSFCGVVNVEEMLDC